MERKRIKKKKKKEQLQTATSGIPLEFPVTDCDADFASTNSPIMHVHDNHNK